MNTPNKKNSGDLKHHLAAFGFTVLFAIFFKWETTDIIWALWICSFVFGYSWILMTVIPPVLKLPVDQKGGGIAVAAFIVVFFTFHFGLFHLVHGVFLSHFFPIEGLEFGPQGPLIIFKCAWVAFTKGWPLILGTFISRWNSLPFRNNDSINPIEMFKPYINVVRMHILIFVFAGLKFLNLDGFAIYPVLAFYYFPWELIITSFSPKPTKSA